MFEERQWMLWLACLQVRFALHEISSTSCCFAGGLARDSVLTKLVAPWQFSWHHEVLILSWCLPFTVLTDCQELILLANPTIGRQYINSKRKELSRTHFAMERSTKLLEGFRVSGKPSHCEACIEDQDVEVRHSTARTLITICPEGNQAGKFFHDLAVDETG